MDKILKKKYKKAIDLFTQSEKILSGFPTEVSALGSRFAECYLGLGDLVRAEKKAKQNLEIREHDQVLDLQFLFLELLLNLK